MKLNEVLDVFGNESLEAVMTPEQEFEASVESLIEEIDNVMDIRAGLESMEEGAVELAKASCESLLTGLAVREMSIANEDADLAYICNAFNVKPELFGLEADEATMKEKIKDKAGKAGAAIRNSRAAKATAAIYAKIVAFVKSFFSFDNIVIRMVKKLSEKAKGLLKKGVAEGEEVTDSATIEILDAYGNVIGTVKDEIKTKKFQSVIDRLTTTTAKLKEMDFKKPFVSAGEFLKKVAGLKHEGGEKVSDAELTEAVKDVEPGLAKKVLQTLQGFMVAVKGAFKKAISIDLKSLFKIGKGKEAKPAATTESVEFGIEALDSLFGEIKRVEAGIEEEVEVPEEYAEIGVEGMEMFEEFDAFEATMEAVESVEEMYIEATIPSQIAALESIAIEKGLNPDNGVSFDLFGTMSAGIEAAEEVVEKASEETKKTMKERVKGGVEKLRKTVKSVVAFAINKLAGFRLIPLSLKKMMDKIEKMDEVQYVDYMKQVSGDINAMLAAIYAANTLAEAMKLGYQPEGSVAVPKFEFKAETPKEELLKALKEAYELGKSMKIPKGNAEDIEFLMNKARNMHNIAGFRKFISKIGSTIKSGLTGAKNGLVKLAGKVKDKVSKKKAEAPVEQPAEA